jgi:hypothetical protein
LLLYLLIFSALHCHNSHKPLNHLTWTFYFIIPSFSSFSMFTFCVRCIYTGIFNSIEFIEIYNYKKNI